MEGQKDLVGRHHVSPSQLRMHDFCEVQYDFRYIQGKRVPPGIALLKGSGAHAAAEINYRQKIDSHADLPTPTLQEAAINEVEKRVYTDGLLLDPAEVSRGSQAVLDEMKDALAYRVVPLYANIVAPKVQPRLVEEEILIPLPSQTFDLYGRLDLVDDKETIIDLKTSGRTTPQSTVDESIQLTWYYASYRYRHGTDPSGLRLDVLVDKKEPEAKTIETSRSPEDVDVLLRRLNGMMARLRAGVPPKPAPVGHPLCSPKFCGYWHECPFVNSERKAAAGL